MNAFKCGIQYDSLLNKRAIKVVVSLPDACFAVIDCPSADAEFGADFCLLHTVHIAIEYGKLQSGELQGVYKLIVFRVICLLLFKTIHWIHRQRFVVREVYGFNDSTTPISPIT